MKRDRVKASVEEDVLTNEQLICMAERLLRRATSALGIYAHQAMVQVRDDIIALLPEFTKRSDEILKQAEKSRLDGVRRARGVVDE